MLENLGVFPERGRPHTLWIGTGAGARQLVNLARRLEECLIEEGFAAEERALVPHLTVARIKGRLPSGALDGLREETRIGSMRVESLVLMESRPEGRVHVHVPLDIVALKAPT